MCFSLPNVQLLYGAPDVVHDLCTSMYYRDITSEITLNKAFKRNMGNFKNNILHVVHVHVVILDAN